MISSMYVEFQGCISSIYNNVCVVKNVPSITSIIQNNLTLDGKKFL